MMKNDNMEVAEIAAWIEKTRDNKRLAEFITGLSKGEMELLRHFMELLSAVDNS